MTDLLKAAQQVLALYDGPYGLQCTNTPLMIEYFKELRKAVAAEEIKELEARCAL